jgi:hypothetical protein
VEHGDRVVNPHVGVEQDLAAVHRVVIIEVGGVDWLHRC